MADKLDFDDVFHEQDENHTFAEAERKRGGRPKKLGEKADQKINIYLTPTQLKELKDFCEDQGFPMTTFIKKAVFEKIKKTSK